MTAAAPAPEPEPQYEVGGFVWANAALQSGGLQWLAHVEGQHPIRTFTGVRWLVRIRNKSGWTSAARHMYVQRKLTAVEFVTARAQGLIPPAGERP